MHILSEYGLFLLEVLTIVIAILLTITGIMALTHKEKPSLRVTPLNKKYQQTVHSMQKNLLDKKQHKKAYKELKKKKTDHDKPRMFVLDFDGDIKASRVKNLRQEVNAILAVASDKDEVVIRIDSPGGSVNGYGLAASQLQRIRDKNIALTACVDKVAASGGYLMASVANKILAAPFAIIGSIGVVAQLPNFHRWLKKNNIDIEMLTAGEYKRTLTMLGQNTDKGRQKFQEDLELIHQSFRDSVSQNRHQLDIDKVSTGEHWLARDAFDLKLVDKLMTSDDYVIDNLEKFNIYQVEYQTKAGLTEKLLKPVAQLTSPWS